MHAKFLIHLNLIDLIASYEDGFCMSLVRYRMIENRARVSCIATLLFKVAKVQVDLCIAHNVK
jgi:hypothetical protein